ncbi:MAG: hypothetical protein Q9170_003835 [Blastenia crenularia]
MYHSISLAFAVSSFYLGNIIAAPAALPLNLRDVTPSLTSSIPTTATASHISSTTITTSPNIRRAQPQGDISMLDDLVFPQKISSSPSPSSSAASSTFLFSVTHSPKATGKPVKLAAKKLSHEPRAQDPSFEALEELSFPQKISSSSAPAATTSTAFELSPTNHAVTLDPLDKISSGFEAILGLGESKFLEARLQKALFLSGPAGQTTSRAIASSLGKRRADPRKARQRDSSLDIGCRIAFSTGYTVRGNCIDTWSWVVVLARQRQAVSEGQIVNRVSKNRG